MKAKVFSMVAATKKNPDHVLNEMLSTWLEAENVLHIESVTPINYDHYALLVVFYWDSPQTVDMRRRPDEPLCGQCKKQAAIEGLKVCGDCRKYQKDYRDKRKQEKKENRYP